MILKPCSKNPRARDRIGGDTLSSQLRLQEALTEAQYPTVMAEAQLGTQRTRSAMTSQHDRPLSKDLPFPQKHEYVYCDNLQLEMWP